MTYEPMQEEAAELIDDLLQMLTDAGMVNADDEVPDGWTDRLVTAATLALQAARDDGFEAGEEAGRISGQEQAERDIEENIAYELRDCIGGDPWSHRAREAGLDARAVNLPADILGSVVLPVDDVTLTMPEHEAYRLLALVRDAARLAGV